jgi:AMME syndrome candidate gene 1 protein
MPITQRELSSLECSITLLTHFETISDPMDWEIGKHGLRINFTHNGRRYGSTYLPDVAREQGWTKEETLMSLMRKAGWNGRREDWRKVSNLNVVRYQGSKTSLAYHEWAEWKEWIEETGRDEMEI